MTNIEIIRFTFIITTIFSTYYPDYFSLKQWNDMAYYTPWPGFANNPLKQILSVGCNCPVSIKKQVRKRYNEITFISNKKKKSI